MRFRGVGACKKKVASRGGGGAAKEKRSVKGGVGSPKIITVECCDDCIYKSAKILTECPNYV